MRDIYAIYTGWNNPRDIWKLKDQDLYILVDGQENKVLKDGLASEFKKDYREVNHHMIGHKHSSKVAGLLHRLPKHPHNHPIYNHIFDKYWELGS